MGEHTAISWCQHTFNPWIGCMKLSPACDGCYAEALMDKRLGRAEWGRPGAGTGTRARTSAQTWKEPYRWNRLAEQRGTRPFVFCASLADVFDTHVPPDWRRDLFNVIRDTPQLVYLLLTKRPGNIVSMVKEVGFMSPNIALGTTIEDRQRALQNLPRLSVAAGLRPLFLFASCEPLLGDLGDLSPWMSGDSFPQRLEPGERYENGIKVGADGRPKLPAVAWWITGGETDQGQHRARPWHPDWARNIRDQAARFDRAFHHKQNGEWLPFEGLLSEAPPHDGLCVWNEEFPGVASIRVGKRRSGRTIDGRTHDAMPRVAA